MLTNKNRVPKVSKEPHGFPKLCGVKLVPTIAGCVIVGRVCIYNRVGRDAQAAVITAHKLGILQCCHILEQRAFALFCIVGAGFISCIAAKPFASKAAPKANKTGKGGVIVFVFPYILILLKSDVLRQVISVLNALEHCNEILMPVI